MKKAIHIFSDGELKRKDNTLYFETNTDKKYIPVENTSEIMIHGEVTLNKRFLEFITQSEIILHFFNHYGYYIGSFYPREHLNSGYMILKQSEYYMNIEKRITLAKKFVQGAVDNINKVLTYYLNRQKNLDEYINKIKELAETLDTFNNIDEIMEPAATESMDTLRRTIIPMIEVKIKPI